MFWKGPCTGGVHAPGTSMNVVSYVSTWNIVQLNVTFPFKLKSSPSMSVINVVHAKLLLVLGLFGVIVIFLK